MDIDRNFLEEMLIMGEDEEPKTDNNIVYMAPAEETKTVLLTLTELRLLDRVLQEAASRKATAPWLTAYDAGRLNIIRRKLSLKERDKAVGH